MKKKFFIFCFLSFLIFTFYTLYIYISYRPLDIIESIEKNYSTTILDDKDNILHIFLNKGEQLHIKSEDKIPRSLKEAVILYEDRKFYSHFGVDFKAILRSVKSNLFSKKRYGGSTISMQAVKLIEPKKRTYFNKYTEIIKAIKLENTLSKEEILNLYLNNAPYGGNIIGYKTASCVYFNKLPYELSWAEGSLLAVLPNSPSLINIVKNRNLLIQKRDSLMKKLLENKKIDEDTYRLGLKESLPDKKYSFNKIAPHISRRLKYSHEEKNIKSTIDSELQAKVEQIIGTNMEILKRQGINNAAAIVIENKTGDVKAYVGSNDFYDFKNNGQVDGVKSYRSPGSMLKPFLYALSMDSGLISSESIYPDIPTYFGTFNPVNSDKKYRGVVKMETALIKSLNIPFVYLLLDYGENNFFYFLKNVLNFQDNNYKNYGLSLILGTKEIRLEDLGKLYSGLANYGEFKDLNYTFKDKEKSSKIKLISDGAAYLTLKAMKNLERPGYEKYYKTTQPVSWKTGTSYGRKDAWAGGSTPKWTVIVWTGNFNGAPNEKIIGVTSSGNIFFNIMAEFAEDKVDFEINSDKLRKMKVDSKTGYRLSYDIPYIEVDYPKDAEPLRVSPYLKKIFINSENKVIDSRDSDFKDRKEKIILNYPVEIINYLMQVDENIEDLFFHIDNIKTTKFIYPKNNFSIILPQDFDGKKELVVKITNLKNKNIYWYLNKKFLGIDNKTERKFDLEVGEYTLSIVSEDGERDQVKFSVKSNK